MLAAQTHMLLYYSATEQVRDKAMEEDENIDDQVKAIPSTFFFYADDTRLSGTVCLKATVFVLP